MEMNRINHALLSVISDLVTARPTVTQQKAEAAITNIYNTYIMGDKVEGNKTTTTIQGDNVAGDKIGGDKVMRNKTVTNNMGISNSNLPTGNNNVSIYGYMSAFVIVIGGLAAAFNFLDTTKSILLVAAGVLFLTIIGAMQLRNDDKLKEESFTGLMVMVFKKIPIISWFTRKEA